MTMTAEDRIIAFAQHLESPEAQGQQVAQARGWLDAAGRATRDGHALVCALREQTGTRTLFRNLV